MENLTILTSLTSSMFFLWLGLSFGNFTYQLLCFIFGKEYSWATATERSVFQFVAFFTLWLSIKLGM